jgi:hypothetical protein
MTIRMKFHIAMLTWLVGGLSLALATLLLSRYFLISLAVLMLTVGGFCLALKCPKCRKPVLNNPIRILGIELYVVTPWIPRKCTRCGAELN